MNNVKREESSRYIDGEFISAQDSTERKLLVNFMT